MSESIKCTLFEYLLDRSRYFHYIESSPDGTIRMCSAAVFQTLQRPGEQVHGHSLWELMPSSDAEALRTRLADASATGQPFLLNLLDREDAPRTITCRLDPSSDGFAISGEPLDQHEWTLHAEVLRLNNELSVLLRDNVQKTRALEATAAELKASYWHLKKIQEFLPICVECGRVKTSESQWEPVAAYLRENSLFLTHGYCPPCAQRFMSTLK